MNLSNRYHFVWKTQTIQTGGIHPINQDVCEYIKKFFAEIKNRISKVGKEKSSVR
jgi:hypothetical protein